MFDWVVVFNDGVIQQLLMLDDFYEDLQNFFVVQFIGENNKLNGKVIEIQGEECLVELIDGIWFKVDKVNVVLVGDKIILLFWFEWVEFDINDFMDNFVNGWIEEFVYFGDYICV